MSRTRQSDDDPSTINVMIGTAGHIDHGKTALVRLLTGCDTDCLSEEKQRGLSINLGFAPCVLEGKRRVGIVDVPGHEKFIRNMVAGVTGIDIILLVVAADDGVMPQTIEHLRIVELLGIKRGIIALTKIDLVDDDMTSLATDEVRELLADTFLKDAPIVPVSSETGEGFDVFWDELNKLVEGTTPRDIGGVFRMPVERVFSMQGYGTIVTGIPTTGEVSVGDTVQLLPDDMTGRVRGLQVYGTDSNTSRAGQCTALNLAGVNRSDVERGAILATPGYFHPVRTIEARLNLLPDKPTALKHNERIRLHAGTSEILGRVSLLDRRTLKPGETGLVQFRLEQPLVAGAGDYFVIRSYSPPATIGGGIIISTSDRRIRRTRPDEVQAVVVSEKALADEASNVEHALMGFGEEPSDIKRIAKSAACTPERAKELAEHLVNSDRAVALADGSRFVHINAFEDVKHRLVRILDHLHREHPLHRTQPKALVRDKVQSDQHVFDEALAALARDGTLALEGATVKLSSHEIQLTKKQSHVAEAIEQLYIETDLQTPRPDELGKHIDAPEDTIDEMLTMLCNNGTLIRPERRVVFHKQTVERVKELLVKTIRERGSIETAAFRDIIGTSKKYTMALLDHFESTGLTIRVKSEHRLRA